MKKSKIFRGMAVAMLIAFSLFLVCITTACNNDAAPSVPEPTPEKITPVYADKVISPEYPTIADTVVYKTYYIDSVNGLDTADGLTESTAKKSLSAANLIVGQVAAAQPTKLLFKAGSAFSGTLLLKKFRAAEQSPFIVSVYGATDEVKYAKFTAGTDGNCVEVGRGDIRISGLELTSPGGYRGFYVTTNEGGAMKNIVISDCYIHDINFNLGEIVLPTDNSMLTNVEIEQITEKNRFRPYDRGGIIFETNTNKAKGASWYENVWIDDNTIERVSRTGIWVFSQWVSRPGIDWGQNAYYDDDTNWYHHSNVNVRRNKLSYTGGDGVIIGATVGGVMEYNTCLHAQVLGRAGFVCAGLWLHSCKDYVLQFNEAAYTHTNRDGQGFDIDIGNSNILFQYNYSHHNDGGGILNCNTAMFMTKYDKNGEYILDADGLPVREKMMADWQNVTIRNNVFADNGTADIIFSGHVNKVYVYNNTIIKSGAGKPSKIVDCKDFAEVAPGTDWNISNNIFHLRTQNTAIFAMDYSNEYKISNNVYSNFSDTFPEYMAQLGEDKYVAKDAGFGNTAAETGYSKAMAFIPTDASLFSGATAFAKMGMYDFSGNNVTDIFYYGAFGKAKA